MYVNNYFHPEELLFMYIFCYIQYEEAPLKAKGKTMLDC